jgi:hypothetical protein
LISGTASTHAQEEEISTPTDSESLSDMNPLYQPDSEDNIEQDIAGNPYGCFGQTDKPHISSTSGTVNVHARSECGSRMSELYVETRLQRQICFGVCW